MVVSICPQGWLPALSQYASSLSWGFSSARQWQMARMQHTSRQLSKPGCWELLSCLTACFHACISRSSLRWGAARHLWSPSRSDASWLLWPFEWLNHLSVYRTETTARHRCSARPHRSRAEALQSSEVAILTILFWPAHSAWARRSTL